MFLNTTMRDLELYFDFENRVLDNDNGFGQIHEESNPRPLVSLLSQNIDYDDQILPEADVAIDVLPLHLSHMNSIKFRILSYDSALLSYYESVICSSSTLLDDVDNNPYRHLILPMAMQSEPLYHAILAVSAQTLRISDPCYRIAALEHGQMALKSLTRALQGDDLSDSDMDEILALALVLCWFEITDASRPSWVTHLNGIRTLISRCQQMSKSFASRNASLYSFFNRYFAFHLVLARTSFRVDDDVPFSNPTWSPPARTNSNTFADTERASSNAPVISCQPRTPISKEICQSISFSKSTEFLSLNMSFDNLDEIDPYMGFSDSLLLLINEVADLAWQDSSDVSTNYEPDQRALLERKVDRLRESLENLHQTPPPLRSSGDGSNSFPSTHRDNQSLYTYTVSEFNAIAEAYRLGALLLLYKVHPLSSNAMCSDGDSVGPSSEGDDVDSSGQRICPETGYVRQILSLISKHLNRINRTAALPLWPLFLAGCCAKCEEDQITVMSIFEEIEGMKRFGVCQFRVSFPRQLSPSL